MIIYVVSFTEAGAKLEKKLAKSLEALGHVLRPFAKYPQGGSSPLVKDIKEFAREAFEKAEAMVFIGSAGIAVRAIAPFIKSKDKDPAVIVADDTGMYVIPILSGHLGGANKLSLDIASILKAEAVITTSTDRNGVFAIDSWAREKGLSLLDVALIKKVSAELLKGGQVGFHSDSPISGTLPQGLLEDIDQKIGVSVSLDPNKCPFNETLRLVPKDVYLGIGCKKGISFDILEEEITAFLDENHIAKERIATIASIDLKCDEHAILELSRKWRTPFKTFSAETLENVDGVFSSSTFVKNVTGVDNVCERAACFASKSPLWLKKSAGNGVTVAASIKEFVCEF